MTGHHHFDDIYYLSPVALKQYTSCKCHYKTIKTSPMACCKTIAVISQFCRDLTLLTSHVSVTVSLDADIWECDVAMDTELCHGLVRDAMLVLQQMAPSDCHLKHTRESRTKIQFNMIYSNNIQQTLQIKTRQTWYTHNVDWREYTRS